MKAISVFSSAVGSVLFASAITMLIPSLASATFQNAGSPPRTSQATPPISKHLSVQQMRLTKGAGNMICDGDCNNGISGCGPSSLYGGCTCVSFFYHHLECVSGSPFAYSTCSDFASLDCYDYQYWSGGCQSGTQYPTVTHFQMCCGN